MSSRVSARRWANLLNLSTPLGLALARFGRASTSDWRDGLIVATGYRPRYPRARAFTVGNVVLTSAALEELREHDARNPRLMEHEARHASQYALCLGPLMLPLYGAACAWSWMRTGDWWSRNVFETRAGLSDGGYVSAPPRHLTALMRPRRPSRARPALKRRTGVYPDVAEVDGLAVAEGVGVGLPGVVPLSDWDR